MDFKSVYKWGSEMLKVQLYTTLSRWLDWLKQLSDYSLLRLASTPGSHYHPCLTFYKYLLVVLQSLTRTPSMICFHTKIVYFPVLSHTSTSDAFSQIFSSSQIQSHSYFLKMHVHSFFLPLTPSHVLIHNALYSLILSQTQTFYLHRHQCNPTQICTSTYYFHFAFEDTLEAK